MVDWLFKKVSSENKIQALNKLLRTGHARDFEVIEALLGLSLTPDFFSICYALGDIRLWVGDTSTYSVLYAVGSTGRDLHVVHGTTARYSYSFSTYVYA